MGIIARGDEVIYTMRTHKLEDFTKGWMVGDFEPSIVRSKGTEVAFQSFRAGHVGEKHFHAQTTEITLIVSGHMKLGKEEFKAGDILVMEPYDVSDSEFLADTSLVVIKTPSVPTDKWLIGDYYARGNHLEMHKYGAIGQIIAQTGDFYEREFLRYVEEKYPKQKNIIDAGAHVGNHILFYAKCLEYENIYGLEPTRESFCLLERNVAELENVHIFNKGLWNVEEKGRINRYNPEPGCTSVAPEDVIPSQPFTLGNPITDTTEIDLVTIDSMGLEDITMIKLDMEGPELQSLQGGEQTIKRDRPVLFVEISPVGNEHFPPQYDEILELLTSWGYTQGNQWYNHIMYEFLP